MTVGNSHASMSEKSRLESCEKQIVHLTRAIKAIEQALVEAGKEFDRLYDEFEETQHRVDAVEDEIDTRFPRDVSEQVITNPDSEM